MENQYISSEKQNFTENFFHMQILNITYIALEGPFTNYAYSNTEIGIHEMATLQKSIIK